MSTALPGPPAPDNAEGPMALSDLADTPRNWFDRTLNWIPRILSSKPHVVFLLGLGIYLVLLPLFGLIVSSKAELIGGNYTNVTSDIGACIAAGGTLHLIRQNRRRARLDEQRDRILMDIHSLLHHVHTPAANELDRILPMPPRPPVSDQLPPEPPAQQ